MKGIRASGALNGQHEKENIITVDSMSSNQSITETGIGINLIKITLLGNIRNAS